jgi:hypothetical protein
MSICSCDTGLGNTGLPSCYKPLTVPVGLFLVQTFDSTGSKNVVDSADTIDEAYVLAKINHTDTSKRWYPLQEITALTSERGDATYDEASNGIKSFVKQGVRNFSFELRTGGANLVKSIESGRCNEFSMFLIDSEGKLVGIDLDEDSSELYPIRVQKGTLVASYIYASDTTIEKIKVSFDWDKRERDALMSYIDPEAELASYGGLINISSEISGISQTGCTLKLKTSFGGLASKGAMTGLVTADFFSAVGGTASRVFNVNDNAAVAVTVTETATKGTYTLAWASQGTSEVIRITPVKAGYDFTAVVANTLTIV